MSKAKIVCWLTVLVSIAMVATSSAALPDEEPKRAERLYETGDFMAAARLERTAIEYDPQKAEACRYLVIALGHIARTRTPLGAFFEGYADEGQRLIDRAITLEPESPWGHAVLGAWHTEVVAVAGMALAEHLYDASAKRAKVAFETALRLEPGNPVLRFVYAQALVRLVGPDSAAAARNQFAAIMEMTPRDAVETIVASRARPALEAGSAGNGEKAMGRTISKTADEHP